MDQSQLEDEEALRATAAMYFLAPPGADLSYAKGQLLGKRERQEDSVLIAAGAGGYIAWLADGLGGHLRGDEASQVAVAAATESVRHTFQHKEPHPDISLQYAVDRAHAAVVDLLPRSGGFGPASTLVGGVFSSVTNRAYLANIGDSLAHRYCEGELDLLFEPQGAGNEVKHALGFNPDDRASNFMDYKSVKLLAGSRLLLASDGIEVLSPQVIAEALELLSPQQAVDALLLALESVGHPHQDNVSVIVVSADYSEDPGNNRSSGWPYTTVAESRELKAEMVERKLLIPECELKDSDWSRQGGKTPSRYAPLFAFNAIDERGSLFPAFMFDPLIKDDVWSVCAQLYGVPSWLCYQFFTSQIPSLDNRPPLEVLAHPSDSWTDKILHLAEMMARMKA